MAKKTFRCVNFGPVTVKSQGDVDAVLALAATKPRGRTLTLSHVTLTVVPVAPSKAKTKPQVAFQYLWGDWSGISFWF